MWLEIGCISIVVAFVFIAAYKSGLFKRRNNK